MAELEAITRGSAVRGILPDGVVTVSDVKWIGSAAIEVIYKDAAGKLGNELLYRDREASLEIVESGRPWSFDADGDLFRLVSEAHRIRLAYLFDPLLAVHTSIVDPLPHQITAVYGEMLTRQPLRFLLADDPGAGKTIMAGLLIKELMARGDLQRCLIVCPGSLVEQWQDELDRRFHLPFEILTNDAFEAARTGNWFQENPLAICRLDKLSRDEDAQAKLEMTDWDLIVCDEAHKFSATYFGNEVKYTKRYRLGQLLSTLTRHFLLMSATPHNGKEADFQLFLALLDGDRFEGKFRDGVHAIDANDMMRRLVKEQLLKFDGTPLFPERRAYAVHYTLSDEEVELYKHVTDYVREQFNLADQLENDGRRGTVGFALTILQRRLASSPEAIYQSLRRRRERLERRLREEQTMKRGAEVALDGLGIPPMSEEALEDLEDAPESEIEQTEELVVDQASAARTIAELRKEIELLQELEARALAVRQKGADRKLRELMELLDNQSSMFDAAGHRRKLVIFTEHRDTLAYLVEKVRAKIGKAEAVVAIHGGVGREERRKIEEAFRHDKEVEVLIATDAAGEGINLQRAHLMVNYDLPWNPNRLEQRFGRIHRIGQTEVCHLWNLIAANTREGEVYCRLLEKLNEERAALGGQVFDVLGEISFDEEPLRKLLIRAVRYGDDPKTKARLFQVVDASLDRTKLRDLLDKRALTDDSMDVSKVREIREDMERADAIRLQPHFVSAFFKEAFGMLGGSMHEREAHRYEVKHVPAVIKNRDRAIGRGDAVMPRYERIAFEKELVNVPGKPLAAFVCPGHPLLDSTLDLILERYRDLLKRGAILVDDQDDGDKPRALIYLEHSIQDARTDRSGNRRVVSKRLQFVEIGESGEAATAGPFPFVGYRPLNDAESAALADFSLPDWVRRDLESRAVEYAAIHLVPEHLKEVRTRKEELLSKTKAAVQERLTKEINYWDHRAEQLKDQELAGRTNARLNSGLARQRADDLSARLEKRLVEIEQERRISPLPPVVLGAAVILPVGLVRALTGQADEEVVPDWARDRGRIEDLAMRAVCEAEEALGYLPDPSVAQLKKGYDVESRSPDGGPLRLIEVKGRYRGAPTVTITQKEIRTGYNSPDAFILAVVQIDQDDSAEVRYVRRPFPSEPDFRSVSVNYDLKKLLSDSSAPS